MGPAWVRSSRLGAEPASGNHLPASSPRRVARNREAGSGTGAFPLTEEFRLRAARGDAGAGVGAQPRCRIAAGGRAEGGECFVPKTQRQQLANRAVPGKCPWVTRLRSLSRGNPYRATWEGNPLSVPQQQCREQFVPRERLKLAVGSQGQRFLSSPRPRSPFLASPNLFHQHRHRAATQTSPAASPLPESSLQTWEKKYK